MDPYWKVLKKMFFKYGDVENVFSLKQTCVRRVIEHLTSAHMVRYLNLSKNISYLIEKNFINIKWYQFVEMRDVENDYISFDELYIEFEPRMMSFILQCDSREGYSFIPNEENDDFCALSEYYYENNSDTGYCRSCSVRITLASKMRGEKERHFKCSILYHEKVDQTKAFNEYIFNAEMWCRNCAVTSLFMFIDKEDCVGNIHSYKRKCVYYK